jgi:hypothetical protein
MPFMPFMLPLYTLLPSVRFSTLPHLSHLSHLSLQSITSPHSPFSLALSTRTVATIISRLYPLSTTTHYTTAHRPRHNHRNYHHHHNHHNISSHFTTTTPRCRTATAPPCAYRLDTSVDDTCGGSCARDLGLLCADARLECLDRVPVLLESGGELLVLLYEHELGGAVGKGTG